MWFARFSAIHFAPSPSIPDGERPPSCYSPRPLTTSEGCPLATSTRTASPTHLRTPAVPPPPSLNTCASLVPMFEVATLLICCWVRRDSPHVQGVRPANCVGRN